MPSGQNGVMFDEVTPYTRLPLLNPLPQCAGEEANEKGNS
ncbi:hypothetical protein Slit_2934 [Sideroxydans lithotrophicus ES-1]|uniref:Uncharacterized protein n=1 Tax=Sideroxydans lithotrophicus (strain ES-1) TaxID=580332 RepID=D5CQD8_SIDLE|nr:hypothetical protein Slit_2934 [Sideroxydans lithotrophicus ES-1]